MTKDATCVEASKEVDVLIESSSNSTFGLQEIVKNIKYKEDRPIKGNIQIKMWINPRIYSSPESQEFNWLQDFLIPDKFWKAITPITTPALTERGG